MDLSVLYPNPEFSHVDMFKDGIMQFHTVQGRCGIIFEVPVVDLESHSKSSFFRTYEEILKAMPPNVLVRFRLESKFSKNYDSGTASRTGSMSALGFRRRRLLMSLEWAKKDKIGVDQLPISLI